MTLLSKLKENTILLSKPLQIFVNLLNSNILLYNWELSVLGIWGQKIYNHLRLIVFCKPAELDRQVSADGMYNKISLDMK